MHAATADTAADPSATADLPALRPQQRLHLPMHRRTVVQYAHDGNAAGKTELRLYHGDKEISFDEPELFAFGEALARQSHFVAADALRWAEGLGWPRVQALLAQLLAEGVLHTVDDAAADGPEALRPEGGSRPSPLPAAPCRTPRHWARDCEAITAELTGRPLEAGWLELVVPVFRVAHIALDGDGRQVGEANVFPQTLRLEVPTTWRECLHAGTRYRVERPMNVSALKAMRQHWGVMMAVLARVRAAYLQRFALAGDRWTVGHVERLATAVLGLVTWPLVAQRDGRLPEADEPLHPALSSLFRVTDGLRMTMHQMLFVPIGEPTVAPDAAVDRAAILDYAERNYGFHSEHGVCAGPRAMIDEFLAVLLDGRAPREPLEGRLPEPVQRALADLAPALDYALLGLQAYAAVFSLWPAMTRSIERLAEAAQAWADDDGGPAAQALRLQLDGLLAQQQRGTYLASERWRVEREAVFADMHAQCGVGLAAGPSGAGLAEFDGTPLAVLTAPQSPRRHAAVAARIEELLQHRHGRDDRRDARHVQRFATLAMDFLLREQAILRLATQVQSRINRLLGRPAPRRAFGAAEIDIHNLLQGSATRRLPYLVDLLQDWLGMRLTVTGDSLALSPLAAPAPARAAPDSPGMVPDEAPRASCTTTP